MITMYALMETHYEYNDEIYSTGEGDAVDVRKSVIYRTKKSAEKAYYDTSIRTNEKGFVTHWTDNDEYSFLLYTYEDQAMIRQLIVEFDLKGVAQDDHAEPDAEAVAAICRAAAASPENLKKFEAVTGITKYQIVELEFVDE